MVEKWKTAIVLQLIKTCQGKVRRNIEKELYILILESSFVHLQVFSNNYSPLFLQVLFSSFCFREIVCCVEERGKDTLLRFSQPSQPCFSGSNFPHQPMASARLLIYCINYLYSQTIVHIHSCLNHFQII